jgi:hypothetical protein
MQWAALRAVCEREDARAAVAVVALFHTLHTQLGDSGSGSDSGDTEGPQPQQQRVRRSPRV